jgi:hypothetical protein
MEAPVERQIQHEDSSPSVAAGPGRGRRAFLWTAGLTGAGAAALAATGGGARAAAATAAGGAAASSAVAAASPGSIYYAPAASGGSDDSAMLNTWLATLPSGVTVFFPKTTYKISSATVVLPNGNRYFGAGSGQGSILSTAGTTFQRQSGATISGAVVADAAYLSSSASPVSGAPIHIEGLFIDGNVSADSATVGHGLVVSAFRAKIIRNNVQYTPEAGIVLADQTFAGHNLTSSAVECRIMENYVANPGAQAIYVQDHGTQAFTDGYMIDNTTNAATAEGIRNERAAGWFYRGNHCYHGMADGFYFYQVFATSIIGNECDNFGMTGAANTLYTGFNFDGIIGETNGVQDGHPLTCVGNQVWTDESLGDSTTSWNYFSFRMESVGGSTGTVIFTNNVMHQHYATTPSTATRGAYYTANHATMVVRSGNNIYDGDFTAPWSTALDGGTLILDTTLSTRGWKPVASAVAPSATANTYGANFPLTSSLGYSETIVPLGFQITSGGTFKSETLTVQLQATFSDGTLQYDDKTFTASGTTTTLGPSDMLSFVKDGVHLVSVIAQAKSTIASSQATAAVTGYGWAGN